jgi:L-ascorbate metabolism protein UlaG (beta-lactamase superfamily)
MTTPLTVTYSGGPTILLEFGDVRLLTDPTFDPAGEAYPTPVSTLHKTADPALDPAALGRIDAVLLSHDHHVDNLDRSGRAFLSRAGMVLTTPAGADRLGGACAWAGAMAERRSDGTRRTRRACHWDARAAWASRR